MSIVIEQCMHILITQYETEHCDIYLASKQKAGDSTCTMLEMHWGAPDVFLQQLQMEGWKRKGSKCIQVKKHLEPFRSHPSKWKGHHMTFTLSVWLKPQQNKETKKKISKHCDLIQLFLLNTRKV